MFVNDILKEISKNENKVSYKDIPLDRWIEFQNAAIKQHVEFIEDDVFEAFFTHLNFLSSPSRVYRPTAVKILNNAYFF